MAAIDALYERIHEECLPGLWSKGVAIARGGAVLEESRTDDEIIVRVHVKDRPVSPKVSLWPQDDDAHCDCGDRNELCIHVAAAVIAVKNNQTVRRVPANGPGNGRGTGPVTVTDGEPSRNRDGAATETETATETVAGPSLPPYVRYKLRRTPDGLSFDRVLVRGSKEEPFDGSLVALVGGISSGRIPGPALATSKEDFAADSLLVTRKRGVLEADLMKRLCAVLRDCGSVTLDDRPVRFSQLGVGARARLVDAPGGGFVLEPLTEGPAGEMFRNGLTLVAETLRPSAEVRLERRTFGPREVTRLVTELLPELTGKAHIEIATERLPQLADVKPRVVLKTERTDDGALVVTPALVYGEPAIAEVVGGQLEVPPGARVVPRRDESAEWQLVRRLQTELHLSVGKLTRFTGEAAVEFAVNARGWVTTGEGAAGFSVREPLAARIEVGEGGLFGVSFTSGTGGGTATFDAVSRAWAAGQAYVPLIEGGYAPLPREWLERHGSRVASLLEARDARSGKVPRFLLPELARACDELGETCPDSLGKLRTALERFEGIPAARRPADLRAELRHYQESGVDWLAFLKSVGLGALLADDMGLGKTLQALCVLEGGPCLIVCPTSVLVSWQSQLAQFRPGLPVNLYYGAGRSLGRATGVVLTSYSILRLDREALSALEWETVILDEAQTIKNPDSQVAQAAHELRGTFRIALSGTPIENRIDDLWSQFQFLNPGLLGTRAAFSAQFARDPGVLRTRVKPFILRRLKKDVAPELPPRTETVLHCELSEAERGLYDALLAATRQDVLDELGKGGNVLRALEALLRLRQACVSPKLVPGGAEACEGSAAAPSSKIELLLETLSTSIANGHRALVFSQWTSFLDLIEPELRRAGIAWERLDGSTADRGAVVERFQKPDGAPVMLLSLKAGGVGLTLTAADHIFLTDPWWNPAVEDQAADRAHRIGQRNPVLITRLVARDTIEDRILELQKKKLEIADAILQNTSGNLKLTREDLMELIR